MKTINTKTIRIDGGTQSRVEINQDAVAEYAQAIKDGAELPPIVVFHDGADYWLADGFHRFHAHSAAGKASISADIRQGTKREAVLFSCGANGKHGMRRTNADKRKAVLTLLQDSEWAKWSDNRIAKQCEVTQPFVGQVRASLITVISEKPSSLETVSSENPSKGRTYTTKHGTEAVMKTGSIGSKKPEPAPSPAPEIDSDKFNEALSAIDSLQEENERLTERLAVEAMDASEEEKTKAKELIDELRSKIKTLEAELSAVKVSRDTYMRENAELKKQCISQRKRIERLERDAEKAGEEF